MIKRFVLTLILTATLTLLPIQVIAQSSVYLDPEDLLTVHSPAPFSNLQNPLKVELDVRDDDQSSVTYNLVLYRGNSCEGETVINQMGQVAANSGLQSLSASTPGGISVACLQICVGLRADATLYPVCNQRVLGEGSAGSSTTSAGVSQPNKGEFAQPGLGSILSGEFNRLQWNFKEAVTGEIALSYRLVGSTQPAALIARLPGETRTFLWDVSNLTNGQYYLEINARFGGSDAVIKSPVFLIDNPGSSVNTARPLIVIASPFAGSTVPDQRPIISGTFVATLGDQPVPDTFLLEINGEDRTNICQVNTAGFSCQGGPSLLAGLQKVRASYRTVSQQTAVAEWTFTIDPIPGSRSTNFGGIDLSEVNWLAVILVVLVIFLLIFLPWFVWTRWRKRHISSGSYSGDNYEPTIFTPAEPILETPTRREETRPTQPGDTVVSDAGYVDPAAYTSYEDYLKAVSQKLAESEKTYVESAPQSDIDITTTPDIREQDMISIPDYEAEYSAAEKKDETEPEKKEDSGDNTPEWLRS